MKRLIIQIFLFIATFFACTMSGVMWTGNHDPFELLNLPYGLTYAILILTFLTVHEFGHFFAAKWHKVDATLPYYMPFPPTPWFPFTFGTLGAVIRVKSAIPNRRALFDIGISGPLAGFVVALGFLLYGLMTLPSIEYLYAIHPNYVTDGITTSGMYFGDTILYSVMSAVFSNPSGYLPPMNEIYHYPFLAVGWFGLFVTTLNLLPIGQLDGGHILYAMFGRKHSQIARITWYGLIMVGMLSVPNTLREFFLIEDLSSEYYTMIRNFLFPSVDWFVKSFPIIASAWNGWVFWIFFLRWVIKLDHPPVTDESEIGTGRKILGWIAIIILILSVSYNGLYFVQ